MDIPVFKKILEEYKNSFTTAEQAVEKLNSLNFEKMKDACIDNWRGLRTGFPEVIFGSGKTDTQILDIVKKMLSHNSVILITRIYAGLKEKLKSVARDIHFNEKARTITIFKPEKFEGKAGIITAGTGDIPVAEEAAETLEAMGIGTERIYDVGVAGLHRIIDNIQNIRKTDVAVVIAGMEGTLPSVVSGLVDIPVIAVPTSIGYGTHLNGFAPLLTMLNSCAAGVSVVNIDNGFAAGYQAGLIIKKINSKSGG
jgi:NCAIR mutase (PurE)-related protein